MSNYGYSNWPNNYDAGQYDNSGFNNQYLPDVGQPYTGQSYVPFSNEWLPLPGRDRRRRSFKNIMIPKMDNNLAVNKKMNI